MSKTNMRIAILGEADRNGLSPDTLDSIYRVKQLDMGSDVKIDLLLLEPIKEHLLPCDSVFIYNQISGNDTPRKCVKAIEDYNARFDASMIIVSTRQDADIIVPGAAIKLKTASFLECDSIGFDILVNKFTVKKSVYGGNAMAHYSIGKPAVISFNHSRKESDKLKNREAGINFMDYRSVCDKKFIRKCETEYIKEQGLRDSDFVVVCGKGLGSKAAVEELSRWAERAGAVVGGTKKVIDHGWLPIHQLIGQTGNTISPELCLVIGASGATPFINGIIGSEKIIAVNNDADARIFDYADIAIVEDSRLIMAGLLEDMQLDGGLNAEN
ncbi:MAG: electron transfer flavoprotein subunit alpha/FixB family protein [Spirochaetales bacterium]|nr:electron transfer flavoprotein subunit alpha/FixB family protein [Spirochaetales bacterium]